MEIYLEDQTVAYIKKDRDSFYKCEDVVLDDDFSSGFGVVYKTNDKPLFYSLFFPEGTLTETENVGVIKAESIQDDDEGKKIHIQVEYDKDLITVDPFVLKKKKQILCNQ